MNGISSVGDLASYQRHQGLIKEVEATDSTPNPDNQPNKEREHHYRMVHLKVLARLKQDYIIFSDAKIILEKYEKRNPRSYLMPFIPQTQQRVDPVLKNEALMYRIIENYLKHDLWGKSAANESGIGTSIDLVA